MSTRRSRLSTSCKCCAFGSRTSPPRTGDATRFVRSALDYLLGGPAVGGADEDRLRRWFALPGPDLVVAHARARYVVVCTGSSAAERWRRPVALAAVAVEGLQLDFAGCFTAPLRAVPSTAEPKTAILDFLDYLQKSPLVVPLRHPWIDLRALLPALFRSAGCSSLDQWTAHFHIGAAMHDPALGDAFACAQLLLVALDAAARAGASNARALIDLA